MSEYAAKGFTFLPYLNGRVWDSGRQDYAEAEKGAARDESGKAYTEKYNGRPYVVMCPGTRLWRDKVTEVGLRNLNETGANGIYYDQVACSPGFPCFDPCHGHPVGGGKWWTDGFRRALKPVHDAYVARNAPITSEQAGDFLPDVIDGYLLATVPMAEDVPFYTAVYSGYLVYHGIRMMPGNAADAFFAAHARQLLWGVTPGWIFSWLFEYPKFASKAAIVGRMGRLHKAAKKYLAYGRYVEDLSIEEKLPRIGFDFNDYASEADGAKPISSTRAELPVVFGSVWKSFEGKSWGVLAANVSDERRTVSFRVPGGVRSFGPHPVADEPAPECAVKDGVCTLTLAPLSLAFLEGNDQETPYRVSFGDRRLDCRQARVSAIPFNREWCGKQRPLDQTKTDLFVQFDLSGAGTLEFDFLGGAPASARIRPMSKADFSLAEGGLRIPVPGPMQFVVEFPESELPSLHVFANPPFEYRRGENDIYFGPGEHDAGLIAPKSGQTVCLAPGAVVYGGIVVTNAANVRITGRGILDSSRIDRMATGLPRTCLDIASSTNVRVEGIVLRDAPQWSVYVRNGSKGVTFDNVKLVGMWRYNSDGLDLCASEDVTVKNSFVRSFDDCVVFRGPYLKGETEGMDVRNMTVSNCVLWCDWGANLKIQAHMIPCVMENLRCIDSVFANVDMKGVWVTSLPGSSSTVIRNVRIENLELDFQPDRLMPRMQHKDTTRFERFKAKACELALVNNYRYGPHHPADDPAFNIRYSDIRFAHVRAFGAPTPLTAKIDVLAPHHEVREVVFEDTPPVQVTKKGNVADES